MLAPHRYNNSKSAQIERRPAQKGLFLLPNIFVCLLHHVQAFMELASRYPAKRPQAARQAAQHGEQSGLGAGTEHPSAQQQLGGGTESTWLDSGDTVDWEAVRTAPQGEVRPGRPGWLQLLFIWPADACQRRGGVPLLGKVWSCAA